jgi:hypothetical protein
MGSKILKILKGQALTVLALALGLALINCGVESEHQKKLLELQQLAAETPRFPDFIQIDSVHISKPGNVVQTYFYRSSAKYDDVKTFYTKMLVSKGWSMPDEEAVTKWFTNDGSKRLAFRKGAYTIYIQYAADERSNWKFAIDYDWGQ